MIPQPHCMKGATLVLGASRAGTRAVRGAEALQPPRPRRYEGHITR